MQRAIAGALMSLSFLAAAAAQLPPEILVERYLLRAGRLMESKDPKGALEVMSKIVSTEKGARSEVAWRVPLQACEGGFVSRLDRGGHQRRERVFGTGWQGRQVLPGSTGAIAGGGADGAASELVRRRENVRQPAEGHLVLDGGDRPAGLPCMESQPATGRNRDLERQVCRGEGPRGGEPPDGSMMAARRLW